jgi:hypothetical protein
MEATDTDIPPDSGSFDVYELLKMLKNMSYTGPVGLQCYGLRGDASDHMTRSISAWRKFRKRLDK